MTHVVRRSHTEIRGHPSRVISRTFNPGDEGLIRGMSRSKAVIERVLSMQETNVATVLAATLVGYANRHDDLRATFRKNFAAVTSSDVINDPSCSQDRAELIGAYFTQEYSIEGAALFNPSIVPAPNQDACPVGELHFIMSLRAVGEGHMSSIEFRSGCLGADASVTLDPPSPHLSTGEMVPDEDDGYRLTFSATSTLSERVLFPAIASESHGLEDARFVQFTEDDGSMTYYATYTAYDGVRVAPHLLQTDDFLTFHMQPMHGEAARNKGMALFPRRINGVKWCLSRWDRENISVARLEDSEWRHPSVLQTPVQPWEIVQLGACTSPMETPDGWLVLTHGVGPMRTYAIGALLLKLDDPTTVIGVLSEPLLMPAETERNGYVPNVVYSCGALIHQGVLVLPYGCSDASVRFAFIDLAGLLAGLHGSSAKIEVVSS
jgi:predicted GH43/DUF377 family glycosyl hydrolase